MNPATLKKIIEFAEKDLGLTVSDVTKNGFRVPMNELKQFLSKYSFNELIFLMAIFRKKFKVTTGYQQFGHDEVYLYFQE